jgi:lysyl-tRNA synthetase class 2
MLELYQAYGRPEDLIHLTQNLIRESARTLLGRAVIDYQGKQYDLEQPFAVTTIEEALRERIGGLDDAAIRDDEALRELCRQQGVEVKPEYRAGKLQIELFEKLVEKELEGPVFMTQYPAEVSPLARANDADPFVTDRFELFIAGREIANGFAELNDPEDQAARFHAQAQAKADGDEEAMFFDTDYIRALEYGMPPAAGLGIGIDRLVMLLTDSSSIRDVLLFPHMKPESD